jgi:hypothetical protein
MDISTIYSPGAEKAIRERETYSPVADIKASLSTISDALDNGHEFSESRELMPVEISTGDGMSPPVLGARLDEGQRAASRSSCLTGTGWADGSG